MNPIPEYLRDIDWQDIGHDVFIAFSNWEPDRELNPDVDHLPDVEKYSLFLGHQCRDSWAPNSCLLDGPVAREMHPEVPKWQVESWEPLTLSPSLLCRLCGLHGFIQGGRWVPA
jgi:hypothetical protein